MHEYLLILQNPESKCNGKENLNGAKALIKRGQKRTDVLLD